MTVGRFTEKQLILGTIGAIVLVMAGFGVLIWYDVQAIYKNEITEQNPTASDVTSEEEWGERAHGPGPLGSHPWMRSMGPLNRHWPRYSEKRV